MDRSFLTKTPVIAASRNFVCIRLATYEDSGEAAFLKAFTPTRSGQLENTVFGILAPNGKEKLIRSSRGPEHLFGGPEKMAEVMTKIAANHTPNPVTTPPPLPVIATVKLAINIAAADGQRLVVVVGKDAAARQSLQSRLARLAWDAEFMGHFVFASGSANDLVAIEGKKTDSGLILVEPEKFGRSGTAIASIPEEASMIQLARFLRDGQSKFRRIEQTFKNHVREGHLQGVFWETPVPVSDPMELKAREKGKKNNNR